jgi:hypothetical protein
MILFGFERAHVPLLCFLPLALLEVRLPQHIVQALR